MKHEVHSIVSRHEKHETITLDDMDIIGMLRQDGLRVPDDTSLVVMIGNEIHEIDAKCPLILTWHSTSESP